MTPTDLAPLVDCGDGPAAGIYLLRIRVDAAVNLVFGRFARGMPLPIPCGHYLYVGSALSNQGKPALARRVLRHLTRSHHQPPHALRGRAATHFALDPPADKRLRWHIDYLLDLPQVQVDQIIVLRTPRGRPFSGEAEIAAALNRRSTCIPVYPGLGAGDDPGSTHLLHWDGTAEQWEELVAWLRQLLPQWNQPPATPGPAFSY